MKPALLLSSGLADAEQPALLAHPDAQGRMTSRDIYDLERLARDEFSSVLVGMHADQRYLAGRAAQLEAYLAGGGTLVANGHIAYPFLPGLSGVQVLADSRLADLAIHRLVDHPVWRDVSENDLTF